jgi:serine/threonine-protein kinase
MRGASPLASAPTTVEDPPAGISANMLNMARRLKIPEADSLDFSGVSEAAPQPSAQPDAQAQEGPKARILFVDDEERILNALKSIFRSKYHVFTATSGDQAFEFLKRFRVHLIVSDQRMPGMLGVELLRRAKELSPTTVRILLTGYSDLASIVGSINEGEVYRFINKPWNNQDIQAVVAEATAIGIELADTDVAQGPPPEKMEEGILVVDPSGGYKRAINELFGDAYHIHYVASLSEALLHMQSHAVAVIIADIGNAQPDDTAAFKLLKQEHPEILSIVLTEASDSELVIDLINEAQIFRFINKPVNYKLLRSHTQAALSRYVAFKEAPQLTKQHKVSGVEKVRGTGLGRVLFEQVRKLRRFLPGLGQR